MSYLENCLRKTVRAVLESGNRMISRETRCWFPTGHGTGDSGGKLGGADFSSALGEWSPGCEE